MVCVLPRGAAGQRTGLDLVDRSLLFSVILLKLLYWLRCGIHGRCDVCGAKYGLADVVVVLEVQPWGVKARAVSLPGRRCCSIDAEEYGTGGMSNFYSMISNE